MSFDDSSHSFYEISFETLTRPQRQAAPRRRRRAPAKKRTVNYRSRSTEATLLKQEAILAYLEIAGAGATVAEIGRAVGMSRQLALYHVKKMAATGRLIMVSEPCLENGGLQFRCWREEALVEYFGRYREQLRAA